MKKKSGFKKLQFSKETMSLLSNAEKFNIQGGDTITATIQTCQNQISCPTNTTCTGITTTKCVTTRIYTVVSCHTV
jgi:hypothetical protein